MQTDNGHAKTAVTIYQCSYKKQMVYLKKTLYQKNTVHTHEPHSSGQLQGQRLDHASQMYML